MVLKNIEGEKRIYLKNFKDPLKRFSIGVLGTMLGISLYGGALINQAYASDVPAVASSDTLVDDLPEDVLKYVTMKLNKEPYSEIYDSDLIKIDSLRVNVFEDTDLNFLKKFPNLQTINIQSCVDDMTFLNILGNLKNLKSVNLYCVSSIGVLDKDSLNFLNSHSLDSLNLYGYYLYPGCEELLNNTQELSLGYGNYDIDFSKLTSLKMLDLSSVKPYNLAIYLTSDAYNLLINSGVDIVFSSDEDKELFLNANKKLDSIVQSLNINDNSTDQEKLDEVLIHVLESLEYDEDVSRMIRELGVDNVTGVDAFYEGGELFGALEKDSAVCGNYSALVEALLNRVNLRDKSAFVRNQVHAWNIVNIDGVPYLVDATWLDDQMLNVVKQIEEVNENGTVSIRIEFESRDAIEVLKSGEGHSLRWYMEELDDDYIESIDHDGFHSDAFVPEYMFVDDDLEDETSDNVVEEVALENELPQDISDKKFKIKLGGKEMIIGAGALIGILSACGGAICLHKKRENEKNRRRSQYNYYGSYPFNNDYGRRK